MQIKLITILAAILICSCTPHKTESSNISTTAKPFHKEIRMTPPHKDIQNWACLLQHPSVAVLAEAPYDLIVTDYSKDGTDARRFTGKEISILHKFNKTVLCYFSIGEAESYRFYWNDEWKNNHPRFLGPENPDWPENFKVKYWYEDWWKTALQPYLDKIIEAGFDGVYLDIVDAYWFWHQQGMDVQITADEMVKLIARIADYARKRAGKNFIICPQNGLDVFNSCSPEYKNLYFKTIDMVGLENLLFNIYSKEDRAYRLRLAKELADAGKTILDLEYIDEKQYADYLKQVENLNFKLIPYASTPDTAVDRLTDFHKYLNIREQK